MLLDASWIQTELSAKYHDQTEIVDKMRRNTKLLGKIRVIRNTKGNEDV